MTEQERLDVAVNRVLRGQAIFRIALDQKHPAALLQLQAEAMAEQVEHLIEVLKAVPLTLVPSPDPEVIGPSVAAVIADAIASPAPDTIPDDWR